MKYELHKKIMLAVELLRNYRYIENDINNFLRNSDIIEYFLAIEADEKEAIIETLETKEEKEMIFQEIMDRRKKQGFQEGLQQGVQQGIQQGIQQGVLKGMHKKAVETAGSLLNEGMPVGKVAEITGLSVNEVEEIRSKPRRG